MHLRHTVLFSSKYTVWYARPSSNAKIVANASIALNVSNASNVSIVSNVFDATISSNALEASIVLKCLKSLYIVLNTSIALDA